MIDIFVCFISALKSPERKSDKAEKIVVMS